MYGRLDNERSADFYYFLQRQQKLEIDFEGLSFITQIAQLREGVEIGHSILYIPYLNTFMNQKDLNIRDRQNILFVEIMWYHTSDFIPGFLDP